MSEPDRARLEEIRRKVYELTPGAVPLIRELVGAELITGWRNVRVGPPREPAGVTADVYLENSRRNQGVTNGNPAEPHQQLQPQAAVR